ncbi:E3 ubiquitin-protein ligase synoviolin [Thelohanellus kitauei]|uniref:RING-type E3 ubiquitin transferase n=1 Tax=Thelohanellus kitauei TaxID=669202 RepID=A0A0C2IS30_THEKT|nr:E3 ubiquitin-protein ligase synoviolin [Thelohanellus kitauei]
MQNTHAHNRYRMSKLTLILLALDLAVILFKTSSIYKNEGRLISAMIRFCNTKFGGVALDSAIMLLLYNLSDLFIWIFFGGLRPFEGEKIRERVWFAITDMFLAIAVFSNEITSGVLLSLSVLLFLKYFHFIFEIRVESIERDIYISKAVVFRCIAFFTIFFANDIFLSLYLFLYGDSSDNTELLLVNEYAILSVCLVYNAAKLTIHYIDYLKNYTFHDKIAIFSYLHIVKCIFEMTIHCLYFGYTIVRHGVLPVLFIRPLITSSSNLLNSIRLQINCNRVVAYINKISPDATTEELASAHDITCVVCREEMTTGKKLPCGHLFHFECLKAWFQRQQTCPTCRLDILTVLQNSQTNPAQEQEQQTEHQEDVTAQDPYSLVVKDCKCAYCTSLLPLHDSIQANRETYNKLGLSGEIDQTILLKQPHVRKNLVKNIRINLDAAVAHLKLLEAELEADHVPHQSN